MTGILLVPLLLIGVINDVRSTNLMFVNDSMLVEASHDSHRLSMYVVGNLLGIDVYMW